MNSVEKIHPQFARQCHDLTEGQSAYSKRADVPFDVHCYSDGWHIYWHNPPSGEMGRHLSTWQQLLAFLHGDATVGTVLANVALLKFTEEEMTSSRLHKSRR